MKKNRSNLFNKKRLPYNYIWTKENPISYITEGFQKFMANLEYYNIDRKYKVLQISSSLTREGKSTFISNVAYLLSQKGYKTILIDLDLRKPKIHRIYDVENVDGITDILSGRINSAELGAIYEGVTEQKLGLGTVQKLLGAGIKVGQAEKQFEVAAQSARLLSSAARRQRRATTLSAENVLEASIFGDQETLSQIQAIQNQIASASTAVLGARRTQTGAVTGLTEAN